MNALLLNDEELNALVCFVIGWVTRLARRQRARTEPAHLDAALHQRSDHGLRALFAESLRAPLAATSVPLDLDDADLGVCDECSRDLVDHRDLFRRHGRLVPTKADRLQDPKLDAIVAHALFRVSTAVVVFVAVERFWLVRAVVANVRNVILIVVGIRAAVAICEPVTIFCVAWTSVVHVGHSVVVEVAWLCRTNICVRGFFFGRVAVSRNRRHV